MTTELVRGPDERVAWITSIPYILAHVGVLVGAFFVPLTQTALIMAVVWFFTGMFAITGGYHRYFAHRGYKTSRVFQFILAFLGTLTSQKGVLWWAGHHRHHHRHSDGPEDIHSPKRGFWWSHHLWILCPKYDETPYNKIRDFAKYPEIVFLNRTWGLWPLLTVTIVGLTMGFEVAFWAGFATTIVLWHSTFTINSLAHVFGSRRYDTTDTSRNNFWLALLTMGEGWHNNHHHYQSTARNGFFWWEVDMTYYILKMLSWVGIVWDLRQPPKWVLEGNGRPNAGPARAFSLPASLSSNLDALARLESESDGATPVVTTATRVAERASEWAERALEAAQQAQKAAAEWKGRLQESALEGGQRAAEIADAAAAAAERWQSQSVEAAHAARNAADRAARAVLEIRRLSAA